MTTISFTVKGYIWDLLPPSCWDLRILDLIESCLYWWGLIVLAFVARPIFWVHRQFLARLLFYGCLMQAWLYSIVESTSGLLTIVASATVLCIHMYRWSQGHIPIRVSSNVEYSVGCLPNCLYEIWLVQTYICVPTLFRWTHLAKGIAIGKFGDFPDTEKNIPFVSMDWSVPSSPKTVLFRERKCAR